MLNLTAIDWRRPTPFTQTNSIRLVIGALRRPEIAYLAVAVLAIIEAVFR